MHTYTYARTHAHVRLYTHRQQGTAKHTVCVCVCAAAALLRYIALFIQDGEVPIEASHVLGPGLTAAVAAVAAERRRAELDTEHTFTHTGVRSSPIRASISEVSCMLCGACVFMYLCVCVCVCTYVSQSVRPGVQFRPYFACCVVSVCVGLRAPAWAHAKVALGACHLPV